MLPNDIKKLLENPALEFSEELTAARLKRAGITLGEDLGVPIPKSDPNRGFSPELMRKLAGGGSSVSLSLPVTHEVERPLIDSKAVPSQG